jgi:hypothetical protein
LLLEFLVDPCLWHLQPDFLYSLTIHLIYIPMSETHSSIQAFTPLQSRTEVSEMPTFSAARTRRHTDPSLVSTLTRRQPDESGSLQAKWYQPPVCGRASHIDNPPTAHGGDFSATGMKLYLVGHRTTSSTPSTDSFGSSSPESQAETRGPASPPNQQQRSKVIIDPDYDYWTDVADSW